MKGLFQTASNRKDNLARAVFVRLTLGDSLLALHLFPARRARRTICLANRGEHPGKGRPRRDTSLQYGARFGSVRSRVHI